VGVSVIDFSSLPHVVFQILPGNARGKILDDQTIVGPRRCSSSLRRSAAKSTVAVAISAAIAAAAASASRAPGVFDHDPVTVEAAAVELINGVFGVARIVKLNEAVALFDHNVANSAVTFEEPLQVSLPQMGIPQTANKNSGAHDLSLFSNR